MQLTSGLGPMYPLRITRSGWFVESPKSVATSGFTFSLSVITYPLRWLRQVPLLFLLAQLADAARPGEVEHRLDRPAHLAEGLPEEPALGGGGQHGAPVGANVDGRARPGIHRQRDHLPARR